MHYQKKLKCTGYSPRNSRFYRKVWFRTASCLNDNELWWPLMTFRKSTYRHNLSFAHILKFLECMLGIAEFHQFGMNEVFPQIFLDSISLYSPNSIIFATFFEVQNDTRILRTCVLADPDSDTDTDTNSTCHLRTNLYDFLFSISYSAYKQYHTV